MKKELLRTRLGFLWSTIVPVVLNSIFFIITLWHFFAPHNPGYTRFLIFSGLSVLPLFFVIYFFSVIPYSLRYALRLHAGHPLTKIFLAAFMLIVSLPFIFLCFWMFIGYVSLALSFMGSMYTIFSVVYLGIILFHRNMRVIADMIRSFLLFFGISFMTLLLVAPALRMLIPAVAHAQEIHMQILGYTSGGAELFMIGCLFAIAMNIRAIVLVIRETFPMRHRWPCVG
ncbi:MAG: hypothetical protein WCG83_00440 [Candidatus Peregrinibacteria bacterium]